MTLSQTQDVAKYYQSTLVADEYIQKRFSDPLNQVEHQRQVEILNKIILQYKVKDVLEFAPGPARVTAELEVEEGISIDSSSQMLALARARMQQRGKRWNFQEGDVFNLRVNRTFDLVFCFRFLLHFQAKDRKRIYEQSKKVLRPGGLLVCEVMNTRIIHPLRMLLGKKRYLLHDQLYTQREFQKEMEEQGFRVLRMYPVLNHFWLQAALSRPLLFLGLKGAARSLVFEGEQWISSQPYEWVAVCQKLGRRGEG